MEAIEVTDARKRNIMNSPKAGGSCDEDSMPYLKELGIEIYEKKQSIQFTPNFSEHVHRWAAYIQGFSAEFVQSTIDQYRKEYNSLRILDPFAGCGTVLVQSKLSGYPSFGTELNPLLSFISNVKLNSWDVSPELLLQAVKKLPVNIVKSAPEFLKSKNQFKPGVLKNLEKIRGGLASLKNEGKDQKKVNDLLKVAFSSILIQCSNLKRTPCLGYSKKKVVENDVPWRLFRNKVQTIANDLQTIQTYFNDKIDVQSNVVCANAMAPYPIDKFDIAITSPPYMNGMDYVINYKIEMGWLGFIDNHKEAKKIKDDMVVCDNVSKGLIKKFEKSNSTYTNDWLDRITESIKLNIKRRGTYRRPDMPFIVAKYFDDLYKVIRNVVASLNPGGRFILVIGDSLIADVYIPTDLILAKMGQELGLEIEKIEKARNRRSGQVRSYRLRETIVTLKKNGNSNERRLNRIYSSS